MGVKPPAGRPGWRTIRAMRTLLSAKLCSNVGAETHRLMPPDGIVSFKSNRIGGRSGSSSVNKWAGKRQLGDGQAAVKAPNYAWPPAILSPFGHANDLLRRTDTKDRVGIYPWWVKMKLPVVYRTADPLDLTTRA